MKKFLMLLILSICVLGVAVSASAYSVNVAFDAGTLNETSALTGYATSGDQMDGMNVTAFFTSGGSQTVLWADLSPNSGGVSGTGWSLNESGDTFGGTWTLGSTTANIDRILIDAGPGDTVFDITYPDPGTAGSARGWTFDVQNGTTDRLAINATYRDLVALEGDAAVGDLYRRLDIQFTNTFMAGDSLLFIADTDNIMFAGDIGPAPVPEPASMLLLGAGLIGLAGARRKFKK